MSLLGGQRKTPARTKDVSPTYIGRDDTVTITVTLVCTNDVRPFFADEVKAIKVTGIEYRLLFEVADE